ncbi:hypothetical protein [Streptacidiphilus sp. MAP5-3]|uniref:hypothetical protein n=1 Tax=unclassified Streptacidiphilus TaxID=2643834 RepID=UPI003515DDBD
MPAQLVRRFIAPLATVLLALAPLVIGAGATKAHAASFTMFNDTHEDAPNANVEQFGVTDSTTVYDAWSLSCSTTGCSNVPTQSTFDAKVQADVSADKSGATGPIALDFEQIVPVDASSTAQAQQEVDLWKQLITWAHAAEPSAPIGMYSYDWGNTYSSYTAQLYASGYFDFFAPSMYNRWATTSDWSSELSAAVSNDRAISSSLPIYPYVWGQWDTSGTSGNAWLSGTDWDSEFKTLEAQTQGAILWGNMPTDSSGCGFLGAFSAEMGALTGTSSHGPLTVSASPPNSCVIPRGAMTTVPFTVNNNGSSTSTATSLADTTATQSITVGNFEYWDIPALASGASWGPDTLNVTVPSSATETTALLYINYGTGVQRLAVIIP